MPRLTENKIILIVRPTRLDDLIRRFNTLEQARFYVEHLGADFSDYVCERDQYRKSVALAEASLRALGRVQVLDRDFLPNFIFGKQDVVVVLGQDGLVVNTLKYLDEQQVVGVNPDSSRWDGVLLPFEVQDLAKILPEVLKGRSTIKRVTMAKAELTDGQRLYAVNDLYIGAKTHVSARYEIHVNQAVEMQSSSGVIISTGLGSTGWVKSILTGATRIVESISERPTGVDLPSGYGWDADFLQYTVREPFPSRTTGATLVFGTVASGQNLTLVSQMAENGVIFSDGIECDYLEFNSGITATISVAQKYGNLVA